MQKTYFLFACALVAILLLAACGGGEEPTPTPAPAAAAAEEATAAPVAITGDAAAGKTTYGTICIACHGPQGLGIAPTRYPALRGQHSVYSYNQLKAYAAGTRRPQGNDIMQVIAAKLTDDEMRALASYTQGLR